MSDIKVSYPASDTSAFTITLASLATSSTLLAGRESTSVSNTSNLDLDHLVGGKITVGTTPTINTFIEVWAVAPYKVASGTPTWPESFTGSDAAISGIASGGVKYGFCKLVAAMLVDATTSDRSYYFGPVSLATLVFGGHLPSRYALFVTHSTGVNLNSTGGNHEIHYHRVQRTVA